MRLPPGVTRAQARAIGTKLTRAQVQTVAVLGDSRSGASSFTGPPRINQMGWLNWACMLSRGRLRAADQPNFGVAGETSAQILARVAAVIASPADAIILCSSINDATGADSVGNVQATIAALLAAGKTVIALPELPKSSGWAANRIAQNLRVRQAVLDLQGTPGLIVADPWPDLADPAGTGGPTAGLYWDVIHPNTLGNFYIGRAIAAAVNAQYPEPALLPVTNGGLYDATYNPLGVLNSNPLMTGTTGTFSGGATGSMATSWGLAQTANLTAVASKVTSGGKEWQQVAISGTAADANQQVTLTTFPTIGNFAAGDKIEAVCEVDVNAGATGIWGPALEIQPTGSGTSLVSTNYYSSGRGNGVPLALAYSGVLRTPPMTVVSGMTQLWVGINCRAENGLAAAMTFRVRAIGLRKLQ